MIHVIDMEASPVYWFMHCMSAHLQLSCTFNWYWITGSPHSVRCSIHSPRRRAVHHHNLVLGLEFSKLKYSACLSTYWQCTRRMSTKVHLLRAWSESGRPVGDHHLVRRLASLHSRMHTYAAMDGLRVGFHVRGRLNRFQIIVDWMCSHNKYDVINSEGSRYWWIYTHLLSHCRVAHVHILQDQ